MKQSEWKEVGKRLGLGVIVITAVGAALSALLGLLIIKEIVKPELGAVGVQVLTLAALFGVCWFQARSVPKQRLMVALVTAAAAVLVGLLVNCLAFPGGEIAWRGILLTLGCGAAAGVLASGKKTRKR